MFLPEMMLSKEKLDSPISLAVTTVEALYLLSSLEFTARRLSPSEHAERLCSLFEKLTKQVG